VGINGPTEQWIDFQSDSTRQLRRGNRFDESSVHYDRTGSGPTELATKDTVNRAPCHFMSNSRL